MKAARLGVDTGGTFTDVVAADGSIAKVLSTPADPGVAVRSGARALAGDERIEVLSHGTTVATNALLERRGARIALVTNEGLADVIEIARQDRPSLYDPFADRPEPLVPRELRYEVRGRLAADGSELTPLDASTLDQIDTSVDAVAVCLLHADLDPAHEKGVAAALASHGFDSTCSHEVSPEFREYERTATTVINAYLRPSCRAYLRGIADAADDVLVMTSAGGLVPANEAAELPASLLLSGPAGGVRAAVAAAVANGFPDAVTFDMGGTSTDVCLVLDGAPAPAAQREVAGFPVRFPSLDVLTIGAGGGSIAHLDAGGALVVGPESAGAEPGPAAYGRGGVEPTVTDANVAAGRIPDGAALGPIRLSRDAAHAALERGGVTAEGVLAVVNANMERALRAVTVERGVDPRGLALVAFGGAGPLHACELADALGITTVLVPARAGVLSAVGLLTAPMQRDLVRSWPLPGDHDGLDRALASLAAEAVGLVGEGATVRVSVDCRYAGQSHELTVPSIDDFPAEHERRNGYTRDGHPIEVVALRASATRPAPLSIDDLPVPARLADEIAGPRVLAEPDCTVWIPDGWTARAGAAGALLLTRTTPTTTTTTGSLARERRGAEPTRQRTDGGLDPAALQVLISRLTGIAEEMGSVLRHAAFSPNIKERADCSAALFTASGDLLVQAEHIPVHLGSMPASVRAAIDAYSRDLKPGDQIVLNDPFAGGTHLNDITLVAPCFVDGRLVGFAANRAHHADVGGAAPGSIPADATEIHQEGLRIPPTKLDAGLRRLLLANSRTPDERAGDLDAQVGANALGVRRLAELSSAPLDEVVAYGERRMRAAINALPDGVFHFADVLDSTGSAPDQQHPARIEVTVNVMGDSIGFGFAGTDAQARGNVNAVEAVTVSAVAFALRAALDPTLPANGGAMRPVSVIAPPGTIVAARPPAAVGAGNVEVSQRVADVCLGALAQATPDRVGAASQGTMNNLLIGGDGWVYYETIAGGQGGAKDHPGMSGVHTCMTNTKNTPIEALERAFPMRVLRYSLREGSGGAGVAPGGDGIERDVQMLEDVTVSLITERRVSQPWGLGSGGPGATGENWLLPGGFERLAKRLPDKCTLRLKAGDVLRMLTPGGGGWGRSVQ